MDNYKSPIVELVGIARKAGRTEILNLVDSVLGTFQEMYLAPEPVDTGRETLLKVHPLASKFLEMRLTILKLDGLPVEPLAFSDEETNKGPAT